MAENGNTYSVYIADSLKSEQGNSKNRIHLTHQKAGNTVPVFVNSRQIRVQIVCAALQAII